MGSSLTDPEFRRHSFVVIDFETVTPAGRPAEPIEVAAVTLTARKGVLVETGRYQSFIRPPDDVSLTGFDTAQTGITADDLRDAPSAAEVMASLDDALTNPPYRLVAHNAPYEAAIIARQREHCPTLAVTSLLDTVRLARLAYPELASHRLDDLLRFLRIPHPADRHRALPDVEVTVQAFERIITDGATVCRWTSLRQLDAAGGVPPKPSSSAVDTTQESLF